MCISTSMATWIKIHDFSSNRGPSFTCIYGWDPRFRCIIVFKGVMDRPNWKMRVLFSGFTAERVGARHDDSLHKRSS